MGGFVPVGEGAGVEVQSDMFGFAGGEANLLEAFELAFRALDFGACFRNIELGDLSAGDAAGVSDVKGDFCAAADLD